MLTDIFLWKTFLEKMREINAMHYKNSTHGISNIWWNSWRRIFGEVDDWKCNVPCQSGGCSNLVWPAQSSSIAVSGPLVVSNHNKKWLVKQWFLINNEEVTDISQLLLMFQWLETYDNNNIIELPHSQWWARCDISRAELWCCCCSLCIL